MNRYITWILLIVVLLGIFTGCKKNDVAEPTTNVVEDFADMNDAIAFLRNIYNNDGASTPVDYKRFGVVRIAGIPFKVIWTTDVSEDLVKIVTGDNALVTIDVNERCKVNTPYVLTATLTDETGICISYSWNYILPAAVEGDFTTIKDSAAKPEETLSVGVLPNETLPAGTLPNTTLPTGTLPDETLPDATSPVETQPYEFTLTGKVVSIEAPYNKAFKYISAVMEVNGLENMSVLCRQMKGEGIADIKIGDIITVTGVLKDYNGKLTFDSGCVLVALIVGESAQSPVDTEPTIDNNSTTEEDKNQSYEVTLTGTITKINTAYNVNAGHITVTMVIDGAEDKPIICSRMKGSDVDKIDVGDTITVKGYIVNSVDNNGESIIMFKAGCKLVAYKKSEIVAPTNPVDIVNTAYALKTGSRLPYEVTLTGKIITVNTAYSASYKNITVTIKVDGAEDMPILCYRLKGYGVDKIGVEDIITVTGYIEKSQYTAELTVVGFAANCELVSWNDKGVDMPDVTDKPATNNPNATDKPENTDTLQIDTEEFDDTTDSGSAYILAFDNNGTKRFFNGKTESGGVANRLITTANLEEAVIVRLQPVSGGYALCFMNGARKTYIRIYERDAINGKGSLELVSAVPDEVLTFDSTFDTLVYKSSSANSYYLGTYSTYTTLSVYNLSALNQGNVGVSYYPARLYDRGEVASGKPTVPTEPSTPAESTIPTEATTPAESTTPTESTIPTPPSTPTEPATQTTPTVPPVSTTPTTPTESTKPSTPTEPTTPTIPSAPTIPSSPTEPSSPTYPSEDNVNTVPTEPSVPAPEATPSVAVPVAVFSFPDGTPGEHDDGDNVGYEGHVYTSGSYSLTFTEYSKAYFGGYDQLGNGFVKFGSSSAVGSVTFVVPDDVTKVELHLAKYKAKTSKCSINGGAEITLSKSCNNGEYDVVMVDTSVNKTIRISTTSDAPRMVMYAIVYYS